MDVNKQKTNNKKGINFNNKKANKTDLNFQTPYKKNNNRYIIIV